MKTDSKLKDLDDEVWILRLFVAGKTSKSLKAFLTLMKFVTSLKIS